LNVKGEDDSKHPVWSSMLKPEKFDYDPANVLCNNFKNPRKGIFKKTD
jgi:hypothetical protein